MNKPVKRVLITIGVSIGLILLLSVGLILKFKSEFSKMSPMETQLIFENVYAMKDKFGNMFLIKNGNKYIAIDAGNNAEDIKQAFNALKIDPQNVVAVFLTHTDSDHIGALSLFKNAVIFLSETEEQMINGQTARFPFVKFKLDFERQLLEDNQIIDITGLKVRGISTPGHTPGAMCYLVNDNWLFTGDSLSLKDGKVREFNELFNMDTETQRLSLRKLAKVPDVKYIFTAHYGIMRNNQNAFENWKD